MPACVQGPLPGAAMEPGKACASEQRPPEPRRDPPALQGPDGRARPHRTVGPARSGQPGAIRGCDLEPRVSIVHDQSDSPFIKGEQSPLLCPFPQRIMAK